MSDLYRVEIFYPLDEVQHDILYYLYQPIIGTGAISTYMMLYMEGKRMNKFLKPSSLSRMTSFLSFSLSDLENYLKKLEGIGLLKTYMKNENKMTHYIFTLYSPLSIQRFFKNQILFHLLKESLSQDDFQKTIQYFRTNREVKDGYDDITSSFQDVYHIEHQQKRLRLRSVHDLKTYTANDIQIDDQIDLLKEA